MFPTCHDLAPPFSCRPPPGPRVFSSVLQPAEKSFTCFDRACRSAPSSVCGQSSFARPSAKIQRYALSLHPAVFPVLLSSPAASIPPPLSASGNHPIRHPDRSPFALSPPQCAVGYMPPLPALSRRASLLRMPRSVTTFPRHNYRLDRRYGFLPMLCARFFPPPRVWLLALLVFMFRFRPAIRIVPSPIAGFRRDVSFSADR